MTVRIGPRNAATNARARSNAGPKNEIIGGEPDGRGNARYPALDPILRKGPAVQYTATVNPAQRAISRSPLRVLVGCQ